MRSRLTFRSGLAAITLVGLAVRVTWVLVARRDFALQGDDFFYHWQGRALADGFGYINPFAWRGLDELYPSAAHLPLYSSFLGVISFFGGTSPLTHRLASCVLGAGAVLLVGLTGRRIAGDRAGLLGAAMAAAYPMLWINDGMLISESMYALVIAGILLAAYRLWDDPSWKNTVVFGVALGLGLLTRPEAILLGPLIGVPFFLARRPEWRPRLAKIAVAGAVVVAMLAPWLVRNAVKFEEPVYLTSGGGSVLQVANCDATYSGRFLGYWDIGCTTADRPPATKEQEKLLEDSEVPGLVYLLAQDPSDESIPDAEAREEGISYIRDHLSRAPVVALARVGRVWGFYRPTEGIDLDVFFERRGRLPSEWGTGMYYVLLALGVYALIVMRRRKRPISPMIAIAIMVTFTVATSIGITRYRVSADVALTVLGGVALDALWRVVDGRRRHATPPPPEAEAPAESPAAVP
jgi:hypothetical protein